MTAADRNEAEAFGRRPDLVDGDPGRLRDLRSGGRGAQQAACLFSRHQPQDGRPAFGARPVQLRRGQDGACRTRRLLFVPPEDLVKLTSLSGKALFYKDRLSLKHKVLALEEGDGAEEATYAIRNLISAGELVIESTIKDLGTGRLTTMENRVEGPSSVFLTTTNPDTDPETKSPLLGHVDRREPRTDPGASSPSSGKRHTLDGLVGNMAVDADPQAAPQLPAALEAGRRGQPLRRSSHLR